MSPDGMIFGGDYNPEQWPEETWADDARLMVEAGVNLVSLGVFSWSRIQRDENSWDFAWLDRAIDILGEHGVGVNLATATASVPPWLVRRYPDVVAVNVDGIPYTQGGRQHHALTSPDYLRLASALVTRLAERYAQHPAVHMWHVNNEFGCHVPWDYSEHATRAFRTWLRRRYETVEALNEAWNTAFWSQLYADFDEVVVPRRAPMITNPAGLLDFRRFSSDAALEQYVMERDLIRASGATQPITTNFMGAFPPLDYWRWAHEVDVVADDSYPDPRDPESFRDGAFSRDLMRSLKPGVPWILMEQSTNGLNWRPSNAMKRPGQMAAWSEQAVARGARGIMFFQWRQSASGAEKFHSAMVPQAGTETRTWREVVALGKSLATRAPIPTADAEVAILFDWENGWALEQPGHPADLEYFPLVRRWYDALHAAHVLVDVAHPEHDLSGYRVVVAPAHYLLTTAGAESLRTFVAGGGVLVTTPFTDIVDESDRFRPGGYSTQLGPLFGGRPVDFDGVIAEDDVWATLPDGTRFQIEHLLEDFVVDGGEVLAETDDGRPALVVNASGAGVSFHAVGFPDAAGAAGILHLALDRAEVEPILAGVPAEVEAIPTQEDLVLINQSRVAVEFDTAGVAHSLAPFEVLRLPNP
ncbi:MAG TPA: beta-galactosidase [Pseudolysinimonas sp.]|nr:beta-galactosidase [Pseudolysinimonas sp.]